MKTSLRKITRRGLETASTELVPPGSIVVTSRAPVGNVAVAGVELCTNQGCQTLVLSDDIMISAFGFALLQALKPELQSLARGTTFTEISGNKLGEVVVPVPPRKEQVAIAGFIGHVDRRIRRYIGARQRLIQLLIEQKQSVIHRAVTRGLDPNVRLKPSGVEWLGDVPDHWELRRAKQLFREVDHRSTTGTEVLLSLRMYRGLVPHHEVSTVPITAQALIGYKKVEPGQIVMNRMRAAIGMFGIADQPGLVSPDYAILEPIVNLEPNYFLRLFKTRVAGSVFRIESKGLGTGSSGFMRLYMDRFGMINLPVPPEDEQRRIVRDVVVSLQETDFTQERVNREITLLHEYRTRIVADVVTGKLDVREAAARFPDEADEPEPLEGDDALADAEDGASSDPDAVPEETTA